METRQQLEGESMLQRHISAALIPMKLKSNINLTERAAKERHCAAQAVNEILASAHESSACKYAAAATARGQG